MNVVTHHFWQIFGEIFQWLRHIHFSLRVFFVLNNEQYKWHTAEIFVRFDGSTLWNWILNWRLEWCFAFIYILVHTVAASVIFIQVMVETTSAGNFINIQNVKYCAFLCIQMCLCVYDVKPNDAQHSFTSCLMQINWLCCKCVFITNKTEYRRIIFRRLRA